MRLRHWITGVLLLLLLLGVFFGLRWTQPEKNGEDVAAKPGGKQTTKETAKPQRERRVSMRSLQTARSLAALATTREELELARQAERLANHSADLAFADALREAAENAPLPTPEIKVLMETKEKAEALVEADQQRIKQITRQLATAKEDAQDKLEGQLEVTKAQLELDQDELTDAAEDLDRAGGDPQAKIRRLKEARDAAEKQSLAESDPSASRLESRFSSGSLVFKIKAWTGQRNKLAQLEQARKDTQLRAQRMTQRREKLGQRVKEEAEAREQAKHTATQFTQKEKSTAPGKTEAKETLTTLKRFMADQRLLTNTGKRIRDELELGDVYASWMILVGDYQRAALHVLLKELLVVLVIMAVAFVINRGIEHLFHGKDKEKLRASTMRTVLKFLVLFIAAMVILFIVLGVPSQMTTILGFAGAGLTVALKDFIVAFFGWFILMGRNGIRVGDWVEIKGVGGEVVEVGLLRTVILETGSWSDSGHPTGRRVTFVNSFAMEGHYFNFSTKGQWMWDELKVLSPAGVDPYPIIDGIQKMVTQETEANAMQAEKEWSQSTKRYRVQAFSATPGINVVPTASGIEIRVRYITRAFERHETRRNLYNAVVELMHGKRPEEPSVTHGP